MDWIKRKLIALLAPSFLNKYVAMAIRYALVAAGASGAVSSESIEHAAIAISAILFAVVSGFIDKAKNQPVQVPAGQKVIEVKTAPLESPLPKAKEPVFLPKA